LISKKKKDTKEKRKRKEIDSINKSLNGERKFTTQKNLFS
jgi:hypothetical protein